MKRTLFLLWTLFLLAGPWNPVFPQASRPVRIEMEANTTGDDFKVIPLGADGVLVLNQTGQSPQKEIRNWQLFLYNTNFRKVWEKVLPIPKDMDFEGYDLQDLTAWLMFHSENKSGTGFDLRILKLDLKTGNSEASDFDVPEKSDISQFFVHKDMAFTGLTTKKDESYIYLLDLQKKTSGNIRVEETGDSYLADLKLDTLGNTLWVLEINYVSRKDFKALLKSFDMEGNNLSVAELTDEASNHKINSGELFVNPDGSKFIVGSYVNNTRVRSQDEGLNEAIEAAGLFSAVITPGESPQIMYYSFSDFKNFYTSMNFHEAVKLKKAEKKGKDVAVDFRMLFHKVEARDHRYYLLAESYYPEYHTVTNMAYDYYGRLMPTTYTVFDGYKFTNAFLAGFDPGGSMLWDNHLEINNIQMFTLGKHVNILFDGEDVLMAYSADGKITSKVISGNEVVENTDTTPIETGYPGDDLITDNYSGICSWYGNYMLCWGVQKIKNGNRPDNYKRSVFYMNKIVYR